MVTCFPQKRLPETWQLCHGVEIRRNGSRCTLVSGLRQVVVEPPTWKIWSSNWITSRRVRGENEKISLKPPPELCMFTPCFNIKKNREVTLIALCCLQRNHSLWCEGKGDLIRQDRFGLGGMDGLMEIHSSLRVSRQLQVKEGLHHTNKIKAKALKTFLTWANASRNEGCNRPWEEGTNYDYVSKTILQLYTTLLYIEGRLIELPLRED